MRNIINSSLKQNMYRSLLTLKWIIARTIFFLSDQNDNSIILFGEKRGMEARDNAFKIFSSMYSDERRDIYYVAAKQCRDKRIISEFGRNVLHYGSLRHLIYISRARLLVINDGYRDVYPRLPKILWKTDAPFFYVCHGILRYKRLNFTAGHYWGRLLRFVVSTNFEVDIAENRMFALEHTSMLEHLNTLRLISGNSEPLDSKRSLYDFAAALRTVAERANSPDSARRIRGEARLAEYMAKRGGMPKARIVQSGLARHDLITPVAREYRSREIVLFFTWREEWARGKKANERSAFVKYVLTLLGDERIVEVSEKYGLSFKLYLHDKVKKYGSILRRLLPKNVQLETGDLSKELRACGALITDYSSVAFDFVLSGAPVIFYQPDRASYQFERGDYTNSTSDWVGPIGEDAGSIAEHLENTFSSLDIVFGRDKLIEEYPNFGKAIATITHEIDNIPPRVVFVAYNLFGTGGTVRTVTNFANYLFERGYQVEVISLRKTKKMPDMGLHPSIRVYPLHDHTKRESFFGKILRRLPSVLVHKDSDLYHRINLLMDVRLATRLRKITADVVIPTFPGLVPVCNRFTRGKSKVLVMEHKFYDAHKPSIQSLIRRHYPDADGLTVLSERDAHDQGKFSQNIFKLPNGVVPPDRPLPEKAVIPRIVALGRLQDWKRFDLLIDAFARLTESHPEWELHIFGNGPEENNLAAQIERLGLERAFLRGVTKDSIGELARGEICAVPSEHEPFGMVIIEAFAAGRPVVSFDVETGPREIIQHGVNGLRANAMDVDDYAEKLSSLMESGALRESMGRAALQSFEDRFTIEAAGRRFEEVLSAIAGAQRPPFAAKLHTDLIDQAVK